MITEQDRQKARDIVRDSVTTIDLMRAIAGAIAAERERADRYREALAHIVNLIEADGLLKPKGGLQGTAWTDMVAAVGQARKVLGMPEFGEEKA